ncbi:MAG: hypothetical protein ABIK38_03630 [candidate division WOR-3 bacterium]
MPFSKPGSAFEKEKGAERTENGGDAEPNRAIQSGKSHQGFAEYPHGDAAWILIV